jgi:LPXTG-motif cell wall-anchored protein
VGGVLGEFVETSPVSGVLGEVEVRDPEIVADTLGELLEITRLPRTGSVPPTQLIGLLGLILASAGLALRRRGQ